MGARASLRFGRFKQPVVAATQVISARYAGSSEDHKHEQLRKEYLNANQPADFGPQVEKLDFPIGTSGLMTRILKPLVSAGINNNSLDEINAQLESIAELPDDPIAFEQFNIVMTKSADKLKLNPAVLAALQELHQNKKLKKVTALQEAFAHLYRQLADNRKIQVILPAEPTTEEVDILKNELKAFYFKDPSFAVDLEVSVNEAIGVGRIYCFEEHMLDLTTTSFTQELRNEMETPKREFKSLIDELDSILKRPLNGDLPVSNTIYQSVVDKYSHRLDVACGFVAS